MDQGKFFVRLGYVIVAFLEYAKIRLHISQISGDMV
jgi:hypothetical protein